MEPIVYADKGSRKVCMNTLVGQIDKMFAFMGEEYKHSGTFANRKYGELSYPQKIRKMYDPIIVNPVVKMRPHPASHPH